MVERNDTKVLEALVLLGRTAVDAVGEAETKAIPSSGIIVYGATGPMFPIEDDMPLVWEYSIDGRLHYVAQDSNKWRAAEEDQGGWIRVVVDLKVEIKSDGFSINEKGLWRDGELIAPTDQAGIEALANLLGIEIEQPSKNEPFVLVS